MNCKLYIGCVTRNTVDATVEYANLHNVYLGLIPSRRQVDFDGGYISFTNKTLFEYVKSRSNNVILERDHGGPLQGKTIDDGLISLNDDCQYYDIIHIDPWKKYSSFEEGMLCTKFLIERCLNNNKHIKFEISTEQSIREFKLEELEKLIEECKNYNLEYIVIQSGTSLKENVNTGVYDREKLISFVNMVHKYGLKTKEHNGDYIDSNLVKEKFNYGLDAINIAPEFGLIETNCYLEHLTNNKKLLDVFYQLCYDSGQWKKWVNKDFDTNNREKLIQICGHYVLENETFKKEVKYKIDDLTDLIKLKIKSKINSILI
jgi:hypothetical protein